MFLRIAGETLPEMVDQIPYYHHVDNHLLGREMNKGFSEERFKDFATLTHFHKLSTKSNYLLGSQSSFYHQLIESTAE